MTGKFSFEENSTCETVTFVHNSTYPVRVQQDKKIKGEVCTTSLVQLSILLCHRQSYIRRSTSTRLYESLLVYGDNDSIKQDTMDQVMQILSTTNWEDPVEVIKPIRNELCNLMGIRVPVAKRKV